MLEFCDYVDQWHKALYYAILVAVLDRGELDLGQMEINKDMQQQDPKLFANKKTMAAAYQKLMHKTLVHATRLINAKGLETYKQLFVCKSITTGFFRVTQFRAIFLEAL